MTRCSGWSWAAQRADEGVDVGTDNETPVPQEYEEGNNHFTGRILAVTVETQPPA